PAPRTKISASTFAPVVTYRGARGSERPAVPLLVDLQGVHVHAFETACVHHRPVTAVLAFPPGERPAAARPTEHVVRRPLPELVVGHRLPPDDVRELLKRHEQHDRAGAPADRAVAGPEAVELGIDIELDGAAVAASVVSHLASQRALSTQRD